MECLATIHALRFASECGFSSIILEGDSNGVCKALYSKGESFTSFCHLVAETKSLIKALCVVIFFL